MSNDEAVARIVRTRGKLRERVVYFGQNCESHKLTVGCPHQRAALDDFAAFERAEARLGLATDLFHDSTCTNYAPEKTNYVCLRCVRKQEAEAELNRIMAEVLGDE